MSRLRYTWAEWFVGWTLNFCLFVLALVDKGEVAREVGKGARETFFVAGVGHLVDVAIVAGTKMTLTAKRKTKA